MTMAVVLAALGGVDGADDHAVLLGLLARERVVGRLLRAPPRRRAGGPRCAGRSPGRGTSRRGAAASRRPGAGRRRRRPQPSPAAAASAPAAQTSSSAKASTTAQTQSSEVSGTAGRTGRVAERRVHVRPGDRRASGALSAVASRTERLDELDEGGERARPGRRLGAANARTMRPRPCGCGDGLHRGGVHVAVGPVEQPGQFRRPAACRARAPGPGRRAAVPPPGA